VGELQRLNAQGGQSGRGREKLPSSEYSGKKPQAAGEKLRAFSKGYKWAMKSRVAEKAMGKNHYGQVSRQFLTIRAAFTRHHS
jgi:hypothetical protein